MEKRIWVFWLIMLLVLPAAIFGQEGEKVILREAEDVEPKQEQGNWVICEGPNFSWASGSKCWSIHKSKSDVASWEFKDVPNGTYRMFVGNIYLNRGYHVSIDGENFKTMFNQETPGGIGAAEEFGKVTITRNRLTVWIKHIADESEAPFGPYFDYIKLIPLEQDSKSDQQMLTPIPTIPNAQFKEKHPNGLLKEWRYDMTYSKAAKVSTYTLPDGKEALKLEGYAIISSPPVEINYKMRYRIKFKYMIDGGTESVRLNCHDTNGKTINSLLKKMGTLRPTQNQFKIFSKEFAVTSEVQFISFTFFTPEKGSLIISELSLWCVDSVVL